MDLTELFCEIDDFCQDWLVNFSSTLFPAQGNNPCTLCRRSADIFRNRSRNLVFSSCVAARFDRQTYSASPTYQGERT